MDYVKVTLVDTYRYQYVCILPPYINRDSIEVDTMVVIPDPLRYSMDGDLDFLLAKVNSCSWLDGNDNYYEVRCKTQTCLPSDMMYVAAVVPEDKFYATIYSKERMEKKRQMNEINKKLDELEKESQKLQKELEEEYSKLLDEFQELD